MEAYAGDAHAVDVKGVMVLAVNLFIVNINKQIMLCDNTIRIRELSGHFSNSIETFPQVISLSNSMKIRAREKYNIPLERSLKRAIQR